MPVPLSVALIVLGVVVLIGLVGYWIDEAVEPPREHERVASERSFVDPKSRGAADRPDVSEPSPIARSS
jgi:hypothetical protein